MELRRGANVTNARRGYLYALGAAVLFGVSTPFAKILLRETDPWLLAGLLYLGAGVGLVVVRIVQRAAGWKNQETPLQGRDWFWLGGAAFFGGILAPVLLMTGLVRAAAATASLLLNLESVFTAALAWLVFREAFNGRVLAGLLLVVAGTMVLSWSGVPSVGRWIGPSCIGGACLAWAFDNNLTRKIAAGDALQISMVKGLTAGMMNTVLALVMARAAWSVKLLVGAGLVGFLGYGVSLLFFVLALRHIGAARTGSWFALAPFAGALISILMGVEKLSGRLCFAAALLGAGVLLFVRESVSDG